MVGNIAGLVAADFTKLAALTASAIELNLNDGQTATAAEVNNAADVSARVQTITASGAVTAGMQGVELANATTAVIAATINDLSDHQGIFSIKYTSTQTTSETVWAKAGTFTSTGADVATLDALGETVIFYVDSAGNASLLANLGTVSFSTAT